MNLEYKGINHRGRIEWTDKDHGLVMEEWQVARYRNLVSDAERCIGRNLTKQEARTMEWLSSSEESTCKHISRFITEAFENGGNVE